MDITPENIIYHEIIGLPVETVPASEGEKGILGTVVNETRNMVIINTNGRDLQVAKSGRSFIFTIPCGNRVKVLGTLLQSQPENRIPKRKRSRGK
jgi:ribonuclease P protein subunit POP4